MRGNAGPRIRCHVPQSHGEESIKPGPPGLGRWLNHRADVWLYGPSVSEG